MTDEAASIRIRLDENASFTITSIIAILDEHIANTSRHFTANNYSMKTLKMTVANNDILCRTRIMPTIIITTTLNGYVVITIIEVNIFDKDISRHLWIDTIIIHQFGIITESTTNNILALEQMDAPER